MSGPRLTAAIERFPIAGTFTISRGSKREAVVVHVTLSEDGLTGHGECVPYAHNGETPEGGTGDRERLAAIRAAVPHSRLIDHGRLHGQHVAINGPGAAARRLCRLGRPRRPPAARARPAGRSRL